MKAIKQITKVMANAMLVSACMIGTALASNLYQKGTVADQMYQVVKPVFATREVTPIFILGDNVAEFMGNLSQEAVMGSAIPEETFRYYLANLRPESKAHGVVGYAMGGYGVPGNESSNRTCAIVLASQEQMKTTSTMFHESVHCKNFAELREDHAAWELAVSMNDPSLGMTNNQFMSLFHEVLAAYVQVAYGANQDIKDGLGMVIKAASPDSNTATSIGFRTARNALYLCAKKDACPTDSAAVVRMLAKNSLARDQMLLDIKELFDAATASGYVVENK